MCLWWHEIDQTPQLFDHSLYQLLFVSLVLPELRKDVVLLIGVFHSTQRERGRVAVTRCIYAKYYYWCFSKTNYTLTSCHYAGMLLVQKILRMLYTILKLGASRKTSQNSVQILFKAFVVYWLFFLQHILHI